MALRRRRRLRRRGRQGWRWRRLRRKVHHHDSLAQRRGHLLLLLLLRIFFFFCFFFLESSPLLLWNGSLRVALFNICRGEEKVSYRRKSLFLHVPLFPSKREQGKLGKKTLLSLPFIGSSHKELRDQSREKEGKKDFLVRFFFNFSHSSPLFFPPLFWESSETAQQWKVRLSKFNYSSGRGGGGSPLLSSRPCVCVWVCASREHEWWAWHSSH